MVFHFARSLGKILMPAPVFICIARQRLGHNVELSSLNKRLSAHQPHPHTSFKCSFMHMKPLCWDWAQYLWALDEVHIIIVVICFREITLAGVPAIIKLPDLCIGNAKEHPFGGTRKVVKICFSRLINQRLQSRLHTALFICFDWKMPTWEWVGGTEVLT